MCLTELPGSEMERIDQGKVKQYMLDYFYSLSKEMADSKLN